MRTLDTPDPDSPPRPEGGLRSLLKLVMLGVCVLLLLVPVAQLLDLVRERQQRQDAVRSEIAASWAQPQTLGALWLLVPYHATGAPVGAPYAGSLVFLPGAVRWQGTLQPQRRGRGLFSVTVYEARLEASGWFARADARALGVAPENVDWGAARVLLGVSDPRGLQARPVLTWGGRERPFTPGGDCELGLGQVLQASLSAGDLAAERTPFALRLALRGTESLKVLPLGDDTTVELAAPWPHPSFVGAPLPSDRQVAGKGFAASWSVPYFGRGVPQRWKQGEMTPDDLRTRLQDAAFGVTLVKPADPYQQTERAVKYAVLFILLTFTTVFVLELLSPVRLHPVSYLLVGAALCLFYLLLLALAEHVGLPAAYALATVATVLLVALYARAVLAARSLAAVVAAVLAALYGWLYVVLSAEDYALLLGASGLFAALATLMFLTRRLDWSTLRFRPATG